MFSHSASTHHKDSSKPSIPPVRVDPYLQDTLLSPQQVTPPCTEVVAYRDCLCSVLVRAILETRSLRCPLVLARYGMGTGHGVFDLLMISHSQTKRVVFIRVCRTLSLFFVNASLHPRQPRRVRAWWPLPTENYLKWCIRHACPFLRCAWYE